MLKHQRYQQDVAERHAWYSKIHPRSWSENGPEIRLDCGVIGPKVANLFFFFFLFAIDRVPFQVLI